MSERRNRVTPSAKQIHPRNFSHYYDYKINYFKDQNYAKLKVECRKSGRLFEDPLFKPSSQNIYYSRTVPQDITWMRPCEIVPDSKFIVDTANANDLDQGVLGNENEI
jgi:hypothetical protein